LNRYPRASERQPWGIGDERQKPSAKRYFNQSSVGLQSAGTDDEFTAYSEFLVLNHPSDRN